MCGDGANDCGALKAAHAGISLSEAESSVASPFTSQQANITCVPKVIKEGRSALVTSFGIFKYMAVYSLTQFVSVIILYNIGSNLTDMQFLYIDLFLISTFALFFGHTEPYDGPLVKRPPSASLISAAPIVSILSHMAVIIGIQVLAFEYIQRQSWFVPFQPNDEDDFKCLENYALFSVSSFQYIIMAVIFSQGKPYRKSIVTNPGFVISLVVLTLFTCYIVLYPASWLSAALELVVSPDFGFRAILIGFGLCNLVLAALVEYGVVNFIIENKFSYRAEHEKKQYVKIEREIQKDYDWPPIQGETQSTAATGSPKSFEGVKVSKNKRKRNNSVNGQLSIPMTHFTSENEDLTAKKNEKECIS